MLCGTQLVLAARCGFRTLEIAAFVVAMVYAPALVPVPGWTTTDGIVAATALYAMFAAASYASARREGTIDRARLGLWALQTVTYLCAVEALAYDRAGLHAIVDGAAGAALVAAAFRLPRTARLTTLAFGLAALTRATDVWAGELAACEFIALQGIAFAYHGVRGADRYFRNAAYALIGLSAAGCAYHLAFDALVRPFFNDTTALALVVATACALLLRELRSYSELFDPGERDAVQFAASLGAAAFPVAAASLNAIVATELPSGEWTTTTQTALSAIWSVAATVLVAWGLRSSNAVLRATGLLLFAVTAGKLIAIDLWPQLDMLGRVISCSLLGVVLIAVAAGYQFFFTRDRRTA